MNSISATAVSGIQAAQRRLETSAHNLANAQTPGFQPQEVVQEENAQGGVTTSLKVSDQPSLLATDLMQQMTALYSFKANLKLIQVEDETIGSLLDTHA